MMVLSVLFHLTVFCLFIFVPESIPTPRPFEGIVYEVNLVELPGGGEKKPQGTAPETAAKTKSVLKKDTKARRIPAPKKEKKPLVIAKRTVEKKTSPAKRKETPPSKLLDRAISRIEKKVKSGDRSGSHVDRAISKLESKAGATTGTGSAGGGAAAGIPMRIYQMEVEGWIKGNWAYPVAMDTRDDLEAVVVLMVKKDGTVLKTHFKKRSSNEVFDQSVLKAIERSDPLPPFPEGYRKNYEEFEINFNLRDLGET